MSKKLVGAICASTIMVCGGICALGCIIGNSNFPWWLFLFAGGIACAIVSMVGGIVREFDKTKKSKKVVDCICASISMISVLVFLALLMLTKIQHAWAIVMIGGIISGLIHLLYDAANGKKQ